MQRTATLPACALPLKSRDGVTAAKPVLSPSVDGDAAARISNEQSEFDMAGCLARVRQRDEDAARALMSHLYPLVMKLVRSHLPRRTSEEDLAQVVFMKIFAKIDQFSGTVPFEHWVSRIAVNTCLNQLQAEKIRPELRWADLSEDEERVIQSLASTTEGLDHPDEQVASRDLVEKLLSMLSPNDRLLINLINLEGHSIEDVKKMTGWNISVIKVRVFRARRKLKKHYLKLMENRSE